MKESLIERLLYLGICLSATSTNSFTTFVKVCSHFIIKCKYPYLSKIFRRGSSHFTKIKNKLKDRKKIQFSKQCLLSLILTD